MKLRVCSATGEISERRCDWEEKMDYIIFFCDSHCRLPRSGKKHDTELQICPGLIRDGYFENAPRLISACGSRVHV